MRTALCLFGQPREFLNNWRRIKSNVVDPNNCDVFFHAWYDPNDLSMHKLTPNHEGRCFTPGLQNALDKITCAKSSIIEKQRNFFIKPWEISEKTFEACWPWARKYGEERFRKNRIFAHQSMWYSIHKSISLKEEYAHENNFQYDCVFVMRFDVYPTEPVNASEYDLSFLQTHDNRYRDPKARREVSDWFMFSNDSNINVVGTTYFTLDHHMKRMVEADKITTNEGYLREQLDLFSIVAHNGEKIKILF
jgi:hypothetical protein